MEGGYILGGVIDGGLFKSRKYPGKCNRKTRAARNKCVVLMNMGSKPVKRRKPAANFYNVDYELCHDLAVLAPKRKRRSEISKCMWANPSYRPNVKRRSKEQAVIV